MAGTGNKMRARGGGRGMGGLGRTEGQKVFPIRHCGFIIDAAPKKKPQKFASLYSKAEGEWGWPMGWPWPVGGGGVNA